MSDTTAPSATPADAVPVAATPASTGADVVVADADASTITEATIVVIAVDSPATVAEAEQKCATCGNPKAPADGADTPAPEEPKGKVEEHDHYLTRWQIWDQQNSKWIPFDPSTQVAEVVKDYPGNFFYVNVRYMAPNAKPKLVMSNWSKPLLNFMRSVIGDDFFEDEPTYEVADFFTHLKKIRAKYIAAKETASSKDVFEDKCKVAESLGFREATKSTTSETQIDEFFTEIVEHLGIFIGYIDKQFEPIAKKLALLAEYGTIEFDLLLYIFDEGQKLSCVDNKCRPEAFILTSRYFYTDYNDTRWVCLDGYGYQFDGDSYTRRTVRRKIREFKGTQELTSLTAQHITPELESLLAKRGKIYTSYAGIHHKEYHGSRVIVDPKAYSNREGYIRDPTVEIPTLEEDRLSLLPGDIEGFNLANKVCPECRRLGYPCPEDVCQSWQKFDVTELRDVVFDENAWEHLVLDEDTKLLIEALVRVTDNSSTTTEIISDVISGKGGGLISVLHGPPGTGKTLTAESIAEHLHRPMYMVGFSELSTSPDELETNLKRILKLATAWDAVLLIDEADVFLEQRSLHELERNALVSVALRLLEYHRGVLFLTTNRITTFDEAFLSRFSIAIKYPELDQAGRYSIWRKFFDLAGCHIEGSDAGDDLVRVDRREAEGSSISSEDLDELAAKPFNGRTIKNLVRTAQALALSKKESLMATHVKTVVRVQEKFLREFATGH